ncbi:MAG: hypothetical protein NDI63_08915 [Pseudobdellovibrio sp.]|nr:hypothetical protein [Pseudobdellovibrio sp.]
MAIKIKYVIGAGLLLCVLFGYQNCSQSGSSAATTTARQASSSICENAYATGVWDGYINGNHDVMTINSACEVASSYCESSSIVNKITLLSPEYLSGGLAGGEANIKTYNSKGWPGCLPATSNVVCGFTVYDESGSRWLLFECGGSAIKYKKIGN